MVKEVWEAYADTLLTEARPMICPDSLLNSSMIVIFYEFELIAVVCEDFSYHPFRLAACSPEEMLEP